MSAHRINEGWYAVNCHDTSLQKTWENGLFKMYNKQLQTKKQL